MKIKLLFFIALFVISCSDEPTTSSSESSKLTGIWVPYEIIYEDGTISHGPFTFNNIFGVYAESFQANEDETYFPVQWTDEDNYNIKPEEGGDFDYLSSENKLIFTGGPWDMEFVISNLINDDLSLMSFKIQYKFKRKVKP